MNPVSAAEFAIAGALDCDLSAAGAADAALALLAEAADHARGRDEPDAPAAVALLLTASGQVCVEAGRLGDARTHLDAAEEALASVSGVAPAVWAQFYRVQAAYRKARNEPEAYLRAALCYLSHAAPATLPAEEQHQLARDMAVAALVGPTAYNVGELLNSAVFERLRDRADTAWLHPLLLAFNRGEAPEAFRMLTAALDDPASAELASVLAKEERVLREKMSILALLELIFRQSTADGGRRVAFEDIARAASVRLDDVEALAIHSMALGLVRGTIDQVDQVFDVQWVRPRVLDATQQQAMVRMLDDWTGRIAVALDSLHQHQRLRQAPQPL